VLLCSAVLIGCGCLGTSDSENVSVSVSDDSAAGPAGTAPATDESAAASSDPSSSDPSQKNDTSDPGYDLGSEEIPTPGMINLPGAGTGGGSGGSGGSSSGWPVTITDHAGRQVTIKEKPQRIVSCYYISTSLLIALDCEDRLVGIEAKADQRNIYRLAAPELMDLPDTGSVKKFNMEQCIALEPDLIIIPKKLSAQAETLSDLGFTVIVVNPESDRELREMITMVGKAVGETGKANDLLKFYDTKLADLRKAVTDEERPTVYLAGNSNMFSTTPSGMYQNGLIENAGGINAASTLSGDNWKTISPEQLIAWDPDFIIIVPEAAYTAEDVYKEKALSSLKAVRNGRVYAMPSAFEAWDSPVPSGILGNLWLAAVLHGDCYSTDDLKKDASYFYRHFYGFNMDTSLLDLPVMPVWPVTITDHAGRRVTISERPEKIVSCYYISTSLLIALDCDDRLVGIEAKADQRNIYRLAAPELINLPNTGSVKKFNMEQCIALEPDLIIIPKKLSDQAETLSDLGFTVIVVNPESDRELREMITMVGKAVGEPAKADDLLKFYDAKLKEIRTSVKNEDRPTVYLAGNSNMYSTAPSGMYQNGLIENAGGRNAASGLSGDNWVVISPEQLLEWDPDYIVIVPEAGYNVDDIYNAKELASLSAVRNRRVYAMPSEFEAWDS
ncbi:MAG: ABC transporter substrate-binding protein, partial [Methanosarcinaceae archaeon]|nr:ABC transporter substrate-binding protein [Methanosarcinaceae archaeon]